MNDTNDKQKTSRNKSIVKMEERLTERNAPCSVSAARKFDGKHEQYYYKLREYEDAEEDEHFVPEFHAYMYARRFCPTRYCDAIPFECLCLLFYL